MTERRRRPGDLPEQPPAPGSSVGPDDAGPLLVISRRPDLFAGVRLRGRSPAVWTPFPGADPPDRALAAGPDVPAERELDPHTTAIVDVGSIQRTEAVLRAIARRCADAAVLILCDAGRPEVPEGLVASCIPASSLLGMELEGALARLEATRRVERMRRFAAPAGVLPILVQPDPDPDALGSALAVRSLLRREPDESPVVTLGEIGRPGSRRMADLLDLQVTSVTAAELAGHERAVSVDVQPPEIDGARTRWAVIDHHPPHGGYDADFLDIRPDIGAASTLLTEYLRADDERRIGAELATALLYGIKTDTDTLGRGTTAADAVAYAFLQARAEPKLLRRIERRAEPPATVRAFGRALTSLVMDQDLAVVFAGELEEEAAHVVADLADLCLDTEGTRWTAAAAVVSGELVMSIRHLPGSGGGAAGGAGALAKLLAGKEGRGGGHETMARVVVERSVADRVLGGTGEPVEGAPRLLRWLRRELDRPAAGVRPA